MDDSDSVKEIGWNQPRLKRCRTIPTRSPRMTPAIGLITPAGPWCDVPIPGSVTGTSDRAIQTISRKQWVSTNR